MDVELPTSSSSASGDAGARGGDESDILLEMDPNAYSLSAEELASRINALNRESDFMNREAQRLKYEQHSLAAEMNDNQRKIAMYRQLPYLVANVVEVLDLEPEKDEDGLLLDSDAQVGKGVVIKTSDRKTIFLPIVGLVEAASLTPGDLIGVNKDSFLVLDKLPAEYDSRVKVMEVVDKPTDSYSDIGGLDKQILELVEAIVLPVVHKDRFEALGIQPPKGVLMYGPPGTGKTMMARACAAESNAKFIRLAGPQLVQMYIGDGAKMVRDVFALAKAQAPAIIFIDEIDAIGTKRFDSDKSGDREVQRTMLELLNQLDGFSSNLDVKVIAATNRIDILDPALLRSGRIDRKIEFPLPNEESRIDILKIHSRKMRVSDNINFKEIARSCEEFNGAQLKAVCVEAGMSALRKGSSQLEHEDFVDGVLAVQAKKKMSLNYIA